MPAVFAVLYKLLLVEPQLPPTASPLSAAGQCFLCLPAVGLHRGNFYLDFLSSGFEEAPPADDEPAERKLKMTAGPLSDDGESPAALLYIDSFGDRTRYLVL